MRKLKQIFATGGLIVLLSACSTTEHFSASHAPVTPIKGAAAELPTAAELEASLLHELDSEPSDIWQRIRDGYGLPPAKTKLLDKHLRWYANNQQHLLAVTQRSQPYIHHVVTELEANDMPLELALLPIIESSYNPFAYSNRKAAGIWQFMPRTGTSFGLEQNGWYDGRRDVIASTDAAIRYLKYLHDRFDEDWLLALAAYNAGQGTVSRAIEKNRRQGKPTDFWSLSLPTQTQSYVPRLLALSRIIALPDAFEIALEPIPNDPYFVPIELDSQINLVELAQLTDSDPKELQQLNAGYSRWLTDPSGPHQILVPAETADVFIEQLQQLPTRPSINWQQYTVVKGDSLSTIARRFNTTVAILKNNNQLRNDHLRIGQVLQVAQAVPVIADYPSAEELMQNFGKPRSGSRTMYTVRSGDSLWKIARQHDTTVANLTRLNNLSARSKLKPGQKLIVAAQQAAIQPTQESNKVIYQIQPGDTLHTIARRFKLTIENILEWNSVKDASYIHPGQKLTLIMPKGR